MAGRDRDWIGSARVRVSVFRSPGTRHGSARTSRRRRRSAIAVAAPVAQEGATLHWVRKKFPWEGEFVKFVILQEESKFIFPAFFSGQAFSGGGQIISFAPPHHVRHLSNSNPCGEVFFQKWFQKCVHCKVYRPGHPKEERTLCTLSVLHRSLLSTRSVRSVTHVLTGQHGGQWIPI